MDIKYLIIIVLITCILNSNSIEKFSSCNVDGGSGFSNAERMCELYGNESDGSKLKCSNGCGLIYKGFPICCSEDCCKNKPELDNETYYVESVPTRMIEDNYYGEPVITRSWLNLNNNPILLSNPFGSRYGQIFEPRLQADTYYKLRPVNQKSKFFGEKVKKEKPCNCDSEKSKRCALNVCQTGVNYMLDEEPHEWDSYRGKRHNIGNDIYKSINNQYSKIARNKIKTTNPECLECLNCPDFKYYLEDVNVGASSTKCHFR